jgi:hypothetical protein
MLEVMDVGLNEREVDAAADGFTATDELGWFVDMGGKVDVGVDVDVDVDVAVDAVPVEARLLCMPSTWS